MGIRGLFLDDGGWGGVAVLDTEGLLGDREGVRGLGFNNNAVIADFRLYQAHYY